MGSYFRDFFSPKASERPTVGDTKFSVINQDHMGWIKCDGRLVSKEEYALLYRVIGDAFGAGTATQFQLPDMRGRVPGAKDQGTGLTNRALGDAVGEETHTLTIAEMPSHNHGTNASDSVVGNNLTGLAGGHTHTIDDPGHTHSYFNQPNTVNPAVSATTVDVADNVNVNQTTGSATTGITIDAVANHQHSIATQGGDDPHNNMQPTLFIGNMFIYCGKLFTTGSAWRFENNTNIL